MNEAQQLYARCSDAELREILDRMEKRSRTASTQKARQTAETLAAYVSSEISNREERSVADGYADYLEYFYGEDR
jgi:hypothetical protein